MMETKKLKIWQWLLLFLIGFLFPIYNILINNFLLFFNFRLIYYIISIMATTVIFSLIIFLIFNHFRKKTSFEGRIDTAFILYVISVSFGSFFNDLTGIGLFIIPLLISYFLEIKRILNKFPRE